MNYIEYFKNISDNINHGNSNYFDHCLTVHSILKSMNADEDVCKAGLYHSVYGTEHFSSRVEVTKQELISLIGDVAEDLVFKFCNIKNRFETILTNGFKFNSYIDKALTQIEYANLQEQYQRNQDIKLLEMCEALIKKLSLYNLDFECHSINNKEVYIFDRLFEQADIEFINQFCLNSVYRPEHSSNDMNYEIDSRFVSLMSPDELQQSKIIPALGKISQAMQKDLYLGYQYINHYTLNTSVSEHTDSSEPGHYTVLIFPNKYWEDTWGGELAFFDCGNVHKLLRFAPGRVIVFDSRLSHKVLPLTRNARKDRYSIAIKCCDESGIKTFSNVYNIHTRINKDEF